MVRKTWIGETVVPFLPKGIRFTIIPFATLSHLSLRQPSSLTMVKAVTVLHKKGTVVKKSWASKSKSTHKYINSMENRDGIGACLLCRS